MVTMTTGGGNKPLTKDEQIENTRQLCVYLNDENIRLKDEVKKLNLAVVSQRSELLYAFCQYVIENKIPDLGNYTYDIIDDFLKAYNCG